MKRAILIACIAALSACTAAQEQQAIADGQLVCAASDGVSVAMQNTSGAAILAKGNTSQYVHAICGAINAIPVSPPASGTAPVETVSVPAAMQQSSVEQLVN